MWTTEHSVETTASPESIWRLWSDVTTWGDWNGDIEQVEISGPFREGSTIAMTPVDQETVELRIAEASKPVLFIDQADLGDVVVRTIHRVDHLDGKRSLVTYRMEISGPAADRIGPELGPEISGDFPETLAALVEHATALDPDGAERRVDARRSMTSGLSPVERFWRNRLFARVRNRLTGMRRSSTALTRAHAAAIRLSGGRIGRSFLFTGGMPVLVITTIGRKSGQSRSTPVGFIRHGPGFAVLASNAGSDRPPAWWLNLQAEPRAVVLADRTRYAVRGRRADPEEERTLWKEFASQNPGFDEYRRLTERQIPVVLLEPQP